MSLKLLLVPLVVCVSLRQKISDLGRAKEVRPNKFHLDLEETSTTDEDSGDSSKFGMNISGVSSVAEFPMTRSSEVGGNGFNQFDHWRFGRARQAGAITRICWKCSFPDGSRVDSIMVWYAGVLTRTSGSPGDEKHRNTKCITMHTGEYIDRVRVRYGTTFKSVFNLQFFTTRGVASEVCPREARGKDEMLTAPQGKHLMSVFGSYEGNAGAARGIIKSIGFYWGGGGGSGGWKPVPGHCVGCGKNEFEASSCTTISQESSREDTHSWSLGVQNEMSMGLEIDGIPMNFGASSSFSSEYAGSIVTANSNSYSNTECSTVKHECLKKHFYQWTFQSNFDGQGTSVTQGTLICSDTKPCCPPGTYNHDPRICDLVDDEDFQTFVCG